MLEYLAPVFFIFAVVDPIGSIPVYLEATKHFDDVQKRKVAVRFCTSS